MTHPSTCCERTATQAGLGAATPAPAFALCALVALLALPAVFFVPAARAQTATPVQSVQPVQPTATPQGAVGPTSAEPEVSAFDIAVQAPPEVRELLEKHLELQRYRAVTDLDEAELARLIVLAERNVRNLVGTLGYFSPSIRITREGGALQRPTIVVAVDPGEATLTGPVAIHFAGDIAESPDPDAAAQR
ncbi:MAG: POTRA domain-containing protein, partial [Polaromonas sp.]